MVTNIVWTYRTCGPAADCLSVYCLNVVDGRIAVIRTVDDCRNGVRPKGRIAVERIVGHCKGRIAVRSYGIRCIFG